MWKPGTWIKIGYESCDMIKNLIFDLGGVLIDLDMDAVDRGLREYGMDTPVAELLTASRRYETGKIGTEAFLDSVQAALPGSRRDGIRDIWNAMIRNVPQQRLEFLEALHQSGRYGMFLLSNTNALHMEQVRVNMGPQAFNRFKNCFQGFYLSHEIGMRKPEPEIFAFVLRQHGLEAAETLFIDDTLEHTLGAASLGIRTWHLNVGQEDVLSLPQKFL